MEMHGRYRTFQSKAILILLLLKYCNKNVIFLGKEMCLRSEQGGGKESNNAYLSLFIKLRLATHPRTRSISFLPPHVPTSAAEYTRLQLLEITVNQEETEICSRLVFSWFLTPVNKINHAVSLHSS